MKKNSNPHWGLSKGSTLLRVIHARWWHRIFGHHTLWSRFVTNTLRYPYLKHRFISRLENRRKKKRESEVIYRTQEPALPVPSQCDGGFYVGPEFWKRQELGLGFDKKLENRLRAEGIRPPSPRRHNKV